MRIFLDANVLVSVLNKEYPLFTFSSRILSLADSRRHKVFISPICLAIAFYFSEKKSGAKLAKAKIEILISKVNITTSNQRIALDAIRNKSVLDFEDGLEYYSAIHAGCEVIITEDTDDFYFSEIPVLDVRGFLEGLSK